MESDRRFHSLEAMRGIAAISVVCFHLRPGWFPSAYLAVDLFFVLSGFVLAYGYDRRFGEGLSWQTFFVNRLIRLWPLYTLGVVLSIGFYLCRPTLGFQFSAIAPLQLAMLPAPGSPESPLYPLNLPGWTLLFELLINLAWALGWKFLCGCRLMLTIGGAALAMLLTVVAHGSADVGGFWATVFGGLPRVTFSFLIGVGICRWRIKTPARNSLSWVGLLLTFLVVALQFGPRGIERTAYDAAFVLAISPLIVWAGSYLEPTSARPPIFQWLGLLSFPIYAIHYPLLSIFNVISTQLRLAPLIGHAAFLVIVVFLATILSLTYDPWLRRKLSGGWVVRRLTEF